MFHDFRGNANRKRASAAKVAIVINVGSAHISPMFGEGECAAPDVLCGANRHFSVNFRCCMQGKHGPAKPLKFMKADE